MSETMTSVARATRLDEGLAGRRVLVTAGAAGIGLAVVERLLAHEAKLFVCDVNDATLHSFSKANPQAGAIKADVSSEADVDRMFAGVQATLGGLDALINNAGIAGPTGAGEDIEPAEWRRGMAVNADSVFLGSKHALPLMRENQPGSIINISSISGLIAGHNMANYNASKAAVWLLTKSIALHCAKQGVNIRCNSIHPTFIRTPILKGLIGDRDEAVVLGKLARQVPMGRLGEPRDVADAVVYLASEESGFMTGAEIKLDGGLSAM